MGAAAKSVANYLPVKASATLVLTSGKLPLADGKLIATGLLGRDLDDRRSCRRKTVCPEHSRSG